MSKYIFAISSFLLCSLLAFGQDNQSRQTQDEEEEKTEPKIFVLKDNGISLGIDVSPFIMQGINALQRLNDDTKTSETKGFSIVGVGRYGFSNRWYAAAEVGFENTQYKNFAKIIESVGSTPTTKKDSIIEINTYDYTSNGTFVRFGVDYDIWHSEDFPTNDNIFIGARYNISWQDHKCNSYTVVDKYWGNYTSSVDGGSIFSHSVDALFGLRSEILPNFYMGWSFRVRFLLGVSHNDKLDPYTIAGYGKFSKKASLGFTYTIEYQIPFNKKR